MTRGKIRITVLEVVFVLALLIIAATMLYPIVVRARERNDFRRVRTDCLSQQRHIAAATLMHVQDHKGQFPEVDWVKAISPYLKSAKMLVDERGGGKEGEVNYGYNAWLLRPDGNGIIEKDIVDPNVVGLSCDAIPALTYPRGGLIGRGALTSHTVQTVQPHNCHKNGLIISFTDGHAKYIAVGYKLNDKSNPVVRAFYRCKTLGYLNSSTSAK